MSVVFVTGFPGFLGSALVERLLGRYAAGVRIACLIQSKYRRQAEARVAALEQKQAEWEGRIQLYQGDITVSDLGLGRDYYALQQETVELYHLAAVYDLAVSLDLAMRVNVDGTRHMLQFARTCPDLRRFQYVSTCFVSGRYQGVFHETDLTKGQAFNNYYEETKHLAEVDVQQQMDAGLPATIYRPAIVVGDSETGETQKYDGPYYIIQWILRQSPVAVVPVVGDPRQHEVNVVPRDFVVEAISYLSGIEASEGKVYQLVDPQPLTVDEMVTVLAQATERPIVRVPMPKLLAKGGLKYMPGVEEWMGIEPEAVDYFIQPTRYTGENTQQDLAGTGITCPPFVAYVDRLVAFMRQHPEILAEAMV